MSAPDVVLAAIERRKRERIAAIENEVEAQIAQRRAQAQQQLDEELATLRARHGLRIRSERERRLRQLREALQQQQWREEQRLIASLQAEARRKLAGMQPPADYIESWLAKAKGHLEEHGALALRLPAAWGKAAEGLPAEMKVSPQDMLGGLILVDCASGRMVDGSWEARLRDFQDAIWQRWREHVGQDR